MKAPPNMMILASAGSGKTYALTNRYVSLLAAGADPASIVALTFTRKAAGEFFDEILTKVSRAAQDARFARKLNGDLDGAALTPGDFSRMLRRLVDAMPQLALSTFDAFFARIIKTFPMELGLDGDFQILEEHAARIERRRVLQHMFSRTGSRSDAAQREFVEAFKRATFGVEEKRVSARLDSFIDEDHDVYLSAPDANVWGAPDRIWPDGVDWFVSADVSKRALVELEKLLAERQDLTDKQRSRWQSFFTGVAAWTPGAPLPKPVAYVLGNTLAAWPDVLRGDAAITIERKKVTLDVAECTALATCVRSIVGGELARHVETTAGIFKVLAGYDENYRAMVRQAGKMTFADAQRILAPDFGAPQLARFSAGDSAERRLLIDWRLDGCYDHWLLDEFQDTSYGQWSVIRNLVDEVMQDASGSRSFFYVGDVKQAIYSWREGDARLFHEIFARYRAGGEAAIKNDRLDKSWRSGPAILAMVNHVFGQPAALNTLFPAAAAERWNRDWADHQSARPELNGQSAWLHATDEDERFAVTLRLLRAIQPLDRGLTVAVLVQKNETANRLADFLRREGGVPAVAEADLHVATDNPLTSALLALLQAAAHPEDTLAREHVRMTPFAAIMRAEGIASPDALTTHTLNLIHQAGFEGAARWWLLRAENTLAPDDAFNRERAAQFVAAARLYDESGDRSVADFVEFMRRHTVRDAESDSVVRVMTIHKAKGLGFDAVILPDLEGQRLATRREGLAVKNDAARAVEWVLHLPPRIFCEPDSVLHDYLTAAEADACYDKLALLYVAMTRAKRAMYLITEPKPISTSHNFSKLLTSTLGDEAKDIEVGSEKWTGVTSFGDPAWFESVDPKAARPESSAVAIESIAIGETPATRRHPILTPSRVSGGPVPGSLLFAPAATRARKFGDDMHRLFGTVRWWDPTAGDAWAATQAAHGFSPTTIAAARACLDAPELASVFIAPPDRTAEVWTEHAFEAVIQDAWVTGRFDRVVVERDSTGVAIHVSVFDFKTDRSLAGTKDWSEVAARHRGQMEWYRRAAAMLADAAMEKVECALVFTDVLDADGRRSALVFLPPESE